MRFRTAIGALCASALVVAGLALSAGTATASTSAASWTPPSCTPVAPATSCTPTFPSHVPHPGDGHSHGGGLGGGFGGLYGGYPLLSGLPSLVGGNAVLLADGSVVNVCSVPSYGLFNSRYGSRLGGGWRGHLNSDAAYRQLLAAASCGSSSVIVPSGLSLVNGSYLNLNSLGLVGAGTVNVCDSPNWDVFNTRLAGRWGNRFDGVRGRFGRNLLDQRNTFLSLRQSASCTAIVVPAADSVQAQGLTQADNSASSPSSSSSAPASNSSNGSGTVFVTPSKAAEAGGGGLAVVVR